MTSELDNGIIKETNAEIAAVLGAIDASLRDGFREIAPAQLPAPLMSQIRDWRSRTLLPGPEGDPRDVQFSFHLSSRPATDFVRLTRAFKSFDILEFHSPQVISIWLRPQGKPVQADTVTVDDYARVARSLFNLSSEWLPRPPSGAEQGSAVSTAPTRGIYSMPDWSDRIDAGTHAEHIHFMFYKRHPQFVGLGLRTVWIDDEFRRRHP